MKNEINNSTIFDQVSALDHEQIVFCHDSATGLKAIIAIHNTVLGPAMGGTRMWTYTSEADAVRDVLRLSRGMTFKSSIAGLNIGGGKAVIIGDARTLKSEALMRRFGKFVHSLGGRYWTAEDVNMSTRDMEYIRMETPYVAGMPESMGGSGDPSPVTAYGVYMGMKAAAKKVYGSESLAGKRILVQGAGHVGSYLVGYLAKEKANIMVSDIFPDKLEMLAKEHTFEAISADQVYSTPVDIYAPCALGATLNDESLNQLDCAIIAGGANNQLDDETRHGEMIVKKGMVYCPDFLINSGGITNVYYEMQGHYNKEKVMTQTEQIYTTLLKVIDHAGQHTMTTHQAALEIALKRIETIGKIKLSF